MECQRLAGSQSRGGAVRRVDGRLSRSSTAMERWEGRLALQLPLPPIPSPTKTATYLRLATNGFSM
jgi:hypothetical protein